jgi:alkanesulfonate monooxygenase SsuD/methylene tetrahydromethanopterin reductase-like flavin-dependent oxidoreductase (luciferase family)
VKFGFVLMSGTPGAMIEQAALAEQSGWDGVFLPELSYGPDAWSLLAAIATRTSRITLGTMLTPVPWRRPWKLASQAATVDQLSGGRVVIAAGLGALDAELGLFGEPTDRKERAGLLDEGIDVMRALWRGDDRYAGTHYAIDMSKRGDLAPIRPVGDTIPIWVVGAWNRPRSMRRVKEKGDGLLPNCFDAEGNIRETTPDDVTAMRAWLGPDHDIVVDGETPADDPADGAAKVQPWVDAGATWWTETRWMLTPEQIAAGAIEARLAAGPPAP